MDAAAWDERYRQRDLIWSATPNETVVAELADLPPGRALDLAAGEGRNAVWLASRGFEVEAVEFSRVALDKARRLAAEHGVELTLTEADLSGAVELAPADLVLIAYLHLPRAQEHALLTRAAAWVAPGGTLLLVGHARRNLTDGVGGPPDPSLLPTAEEVVPPLRAEGLRITRAEEVGRTVTHDDGTTATAIDLVVRAERDR